MNHFKLEDEPQVSVIVLPSGGTNVGIEGDEGVFH